MNKSSIEKFNSAFNESANFLTLGFLFREDTYVWRACLGLTWMFCIVYPAITTIYVFLTTETIFEFVSYCFFLVTLISYSFQWIILFKYVQKGTDELWKFDDFHCTSFDPRATNEIGQRFWKRFVLYTSQFRKYLMADLVMYIMGPIIMLGFALISGSRLPKLVIVNRWKDDRFSTLSTLLYCADAIQFTITAELMVTMFELFWALSVSVDYLCALMMTAYGGENGLKLRDFITDHQMLLKKYARISQMVADFNSFNIICSMLSLTCFLSSQLGDQSTRSFDVVSLTLLSFWISAIFFLSFYCIVGYNITESVRSVQEIAYNCKWYEEGKHVKKDLSFIILRSQRVKTSLCFGVIAVHPSLIISVLRAAYSYFTVLKMMQDEKKM